MLKKHILNIKFLSLIIFMTAGMYAVFGEVAGIIGLCSSIVVMTMLDKDYSTCIISESIKIILTQIIIGICAFIANINYLTLILFTFVVTFVLHYGFTHHKKTPRSTGFLMLYMILVYLKVPMSMLPKNLLWLLISGIFIMILYYLFSKETYFNKNIEKSITEVLEKDKLTFDDFKTRYSILNAIFFTIAIFIMQYFKSYHAIWLPITILVLVLPDKSLSMQKIIDRLLGTIIGCVVFIIISKLIVIPYIIYILLLISLYFSVYPMAYHKRAIFITFLALYANHMIYKSQGDLTLDMYRTGFTLLGGLIVAILFILEESLRKAKVENNNISSC